MQFKLAFLTAVLMIFRTASQQILEPNLVGDKSTAFALASSRGLQAKSASCPTLQVSNQAGLASLKLTFQYFLDSILANYQKSLDPCPALSADSASRVSSASAASIVSDSSSNSNGDVASGSNSRLLQALPQGSQIISVSYQIVNGFYYQQIIYYYNGYYYIMLSTGVRAYRLLQAISSASSYTTAYQALLVKLATMVQQIAASVKNLKLSTAIEGMSGNSVDQLLNCVPRGIKYVPVTCGLTAANFLSYFTVSV